MKIIFIDFKYKYINSILYIVMKIIFMILNINILIIFYITMKIIFIGLMYEYINNIKYVYIYVYIY